MGLSVAVAVALVLWLGREAGDGGLSVAEGEPEALGVIARFAEGAESVPLPRVPMPARAQEVPLPAWSEGALANDYLVTLPDAEARARFMVAAARAGLRVVGEIPLLNVVRVQGSAGLLRGLLPDDAALAANFPVAIPVYPERKDWDMSDFVAFNGNALAYLGVPMEAGQLMWGEGVRIAVLDTGITAHEALSGIRIQQIDLLDGALDGDFAGHGTAVAGLIGSRSETAPGIAPGTELLSIRVLDANGQGDAFTLAAGIIEAVDRGAAIINMSLGSYNDVPLLRQAVAYAQQAGVLMLASTGNDGRGQPTFPAAYPEVLGIGAVDAAGSRAPFSNFGIGVDLAAPGFQIHALWDDGSYIYFTGTSAATPLAAGMAARLLSNGVARTPQQAGKLLLSHANEAGFPGHDPQFGAGILNARRLENIGTPGIVDMAIADFYPAMEMATDSSFPLYVSFENRGTEWLSGFTVEFDINGTRSQQTFSGVQPGQVEYVQIPVPQHRLANREPMRVAARIVLPEGLEDSRPADNQAQITLSTVPLE